MGKTSGSYRLDMETIAGGNAFRTTRGTSSFRIFQANNGASYLGTENNADLNIQTNATNRVIIGASGNSTFTGNVTVSSGTNRSIILDYTAGSGSYSLMSFKQSGTEQFRLWGDYTDNYLSFYNDQANLHQLKLNSDGSTTFGGDINLPDNGFAKFGASGDLRIYHNGSDSVIDTTTGSAGDLYLTANGSGHDLYLRAADNIYIQPQGGENGIICIGNGEVNIYHNSAKKIMTQSTGAIIYGELQLNDANTKLLEGSGNSLRIQTSSGYVDIGPNNSSWCHISTDRPNFYFGQGASWNGHVLPYTDLTKNLGSTTRSWNVTYSRYFQAQGAQSRTKIRVWSGTTYGLGMQSGYTFGGLDNDFAMTFQMSNTAGRGFWWGDTGHNNASGAFACTTAGKFTIAHSLRLGYGESDTTTPGATYRLDVSGSIRATSDVIAFSDRRVKENIVTIDNALEKVTKLRGVSYTRKDIEDKSTKVGVIAQEVLKVLPEVVSIDDEDKHSVSYGNMAGVFIEAIKELKAEVDSLKEQLKNK